VTASQTPRRIGPYPIERALAKGGFGEVFLARQTSLGGRLVCIKRVHPHLVARDDANFVAAFDREIDLVSKLSHEHIVSVFDAGQDPHAGDLPYVVMEYVQGTTATQLLATHGKLDPRHVAFIIVRVASALAYAHRQAVLHRDVKPPNVLLSKTGEVKLSDFGLSKIQQEGKYALTSTTTTAGTYAYMAPEQVAYLDSDEPQASSRYDHRVDLWALGVMAFELLAGFRPFEDETLGKAGSRSRDHWVRANIRHGKRRSIAEVRPEAPAALCSVIEELLRPVDERMETADEVERRLVEAGLGLSTHRSEFCKLFIKDTLPERAAFRPELAETASAGPSEQTASTAVAKRGAVDHPDRPVVPLTTPMAAREQTTPALPGAAPLPSTPERPPVPERRSTSLRPLLWATVLLAVVAGVAAGVALVVTDPFGLVREPAEPTSAEPPAVPDAATDPAPPPEPAAAVETSSAPSVPQAADAATAVEADPDPAPVPAPAPVAAQAPVRRRPPRAQPSTVRPAPVPAPLPRQPAPRPQREPLEPTNSDFGL